MNGLDAWSLPGAARWGATRLPLRGTSWGLWSSPRNRRRLRFPPGLFPLVYLLNPPSRLFGSKISTRLSNRTGVPASLLSPPGNPATGAFSWVLRSKSGGEGVFFGNREPIWGPWSQGQWPGPPAGLQAQPGWRAPRSQPCLLGLPGSSSSLPYPQGRA